MAADNPVIASTLRAHGVRVLLLDAPIEAPSLAAELERRTATAALCAAGADWNPPSGRGGDTWFRDPLAHLDRDGNGIGDDDDFLTPSSHRPCRTSTRSRPTCPRHPGHAVSVQPRSLRRRPGRQPGRRDVAKMQAAAPDTPDWLLNRNTRLLRLRDRYDALRGGISYFVPSHSPAMGWDCAACESGRLALIREYFGEMALVVHDFADASQDVRLGLSFGEL